MRPEYPILSLQLWLIIPTVLVVILVSIPYSLAAETKSYTGSLEKDKIIDFNISARPGQEFVFDVLITPEGSKADVEARVLKNYGFTLLKSSQSISKTEFFSDSRKLKLQFSPSFKLTGEDSTSGLTNSKFVYTLSASSPAKFELSVTTKDALDAGLADAGDDFPDALNLSQAVWKGHIAGTKERVHTVDASFSDMQDWFLLNPPEDTQALIRLIPQDPSQLSISVYSFDGKLIFHKDAEYQYERLNALISTKGKTSLYLLVSSAENFSDGGYYALDYTVHNSQKPIQDIVQSKKITLTPIVESPSLNIVSRFWHIILLAVFGMLIIAVSSAYYMGSKHADLEGYVKLLISKKYSPADIKKNLLEYGYSEKEIVKAIDKAKK